MNHAENFKIKNIISRIAAFIIYFSVSGFAGAICRVIFNSFMRIALRNNPALKDIILYIISLCVIFAALYFFSMREGAADTQNLRFSVLKTIISYFAAGIIFFIMIVCSDIYIFEQDNFFKEYFFGPYYADEYIHNFTQDFPGNSYFISAFLILLKIGMMILAYIAGRANWIARKKKLLQELREDKRI